MTISRPATLASSENAMTRTITTPNATNAQKLPLSHRAGIGPRWSERYWRILRNGVSSVDNPQAMTRSRNSRNSFLGRKVAPSSVRCFEHPRDLHVLRNRMRPREGTLCDIRVQSRVSAGCGAWRRHCRRSAGAGQSRSALASTKGPDPCNVDHRHSRVSATKRISPSPPRGMARSMMSVNCSISGMVRGAVLTGSAPRPKA